jgi:hypothetical protein
MYLTTQRVRNDEGLEELHAFLHLHGVEASLSDPFEVPQLNPGRLVMDSGPTLIPPGGNSVISYLDIVADDDLGRAAHPDASGGLKPWWQDALESAGRSMAGDALPWAVTVAGVHVIFSTSATRPAVREYEQLLTSAVTLWKRWSTAASTSAASKNPDCPGTEKPGPTGAHQRRAEQRLPRGHGQEVFATDGVTRRDHAS